MQNFLEIVKKNIKNSKVNTIDEERLEVETDLTQDEIKASLVSINKELKEKVALLDSFQEGKAVIRVSKNNDHRSMGCCLNMFDFDPLIGAGMPFWLENGWQLKSTITQYVNYIQKKHGITLVSTPELGRKELYEISGHWDHYRENIFPVLKLDDTDEYILRPMTCPHHILLYKRQRWHEKNLPIAFGENSRLYRYESSGGLFGIERTRCMELIDTHIFCARNQLTISLEKALKIITEVKKAFDIEYDSIILSLRDKNKEKFYDDDELWTQAEKNLKEFMDANDLKYELGIGDAAFYGPKIDFQIKTFAGKIITISTIQLDFLLPQKFKLNYLKGEEGEKEIPIMVHLGIIGTLERFVAYLLERDEGWLPFWLSPIQIAIIPVKDEKHLEAAKKLASIYTKLNLRVSIEEGKESLGKKVMKAVEKKASGYIVVGDKEIESINNMNEEELLNKALFNWEKEMSKISKTRSKLKGHTVAEDRYPCGHTDFLRWASLSNE